MNQKNAMPTLMFYKYALNCARKQIDAVVHNTALVLYHSCSWEILNIPILMNLNFLPTLNLETYMYILHILQSAYIFFLTPPLKVLEPASPASP